MRKYIISLIMIMSGVAHAGTMPYFDAFTKNLGTVSASWHQIKILPETTKKFVSDGRVKFEKDVGFIWLQDNPVKQVFVSTTQKYCIDGKAQELNSLPYFYYIRGMINNALNGNIDDLETVFKIDYSEYGTDNWQMTARPRLTAVADILQDMVIYGTTDNLTKVIITYNDGTIVIITFNYGIAEIQNEIAC